jgi:hypothetical protein
MKSATISLRDREGGRRAQCSPERLPRSGSGATRSMMAGPSRTLDELITAAWTGLRADSPIACPLCDAVMEPLWSAGAGVVGGRCRHCETELG